MLHSGVSGDNAIDGGLTLNDMTFSAGTLTLNGANTYNGPTNIVNGTLALGPAGSINSSGTIAISNGMTMDVTALGAGYSLANAQTLTGTGSFNIASTMSVNSGASVFSAGTGLFRTLNVGGLTVNNGSIFNYDIGAGSQDLINVASSNGLTVNGGGLNLFQGDGMTQITAPGTYTLMQYNTAINGSAANLSVLNPVLGDGYKFAATSGSLTVSLALPSVWNGGGNPAFVWSNTANWASGQLPASGLPIAVGGSTGLSNTNDIAGLNLTGLTFFGLAGAYNLTGNSIQLSGQLTNASTAAQTIGLGIGLSGGNLGVNASAGNIILNGVLSDGGSGYGIIKTGSGTVFLTNANTFFGPTTVSAGTLNLMNGLALQNSTANASGLVFDQSVISHAFTFGA